MTGPLNIGAVAIGRNEGARLITCLQSLLTAGITHIVYVDSGSTDNSIAAARDMGVNVIQLPTDQPFTAARARNAGAAQLARKAPLDAIQFIDGDCELRADWLATASTFLNTHHDIAVVCGRRRERFADASLYNQLIDIEWDTPVGETRACGGDALMRIDAFQQVGGFNSYLIAGEEPELCVRLRKAGWKIWRLEYEMTWHDAAMTRFGQWWSRARRAGHAYAEGAALHGAAPEHHNITQTRRAVFWGLVLPALSLIGAFITPAALGLLLAYPAQIMRLGLQNRNWVQAVFLTLGKFPEALGILEYYRNKILGRTGPLIEYK